MKVKIIIRFIAYATLFLTFFSYVETFYRAYFNDYEAIVHINDFGEAGIEFVWITLAIPCVIYLFIEKMRETDFIKNLRIKRGLARGLKLFRKSFVKTRFFV